MFILLISAGEYSNAQFSSLPLWKNRTGFLVLTSTIYKGNRGGLAGAATNCLSELTTYNWKGKESADLLTGSKVKAFLCDTTTCNNLLPNTYYAFAVANNPTVGGAVFLSDAAGLGPGNAENWSSPQHLGTTASFYWSGRAIGASSILWPNTPGGTGTNCLNWTNATGGNAASTGAMAFTDSSRWNDNAPGSCGSTLPLLCIVDP